MVCLLIDNNCSTVRAGIDKNMKRDEEIAGRDNWDIKEISMDLSCFVIK